MSTVSLGGESAAGEPILFETVAKEVFRRYGRTWKPATLKVNQVYLRNQIMPPVPRPAGGPTSLGTKSGSGSARFMPPRPPPIARFRFSRSSCAKRKCTAIGQRQAILARGFDATGSGGGNAS